MSFKEKFEKLGNKHGLELTKFADRILAVKKRAIDEYQCPCYPDDKDHYCISPLCLKEALENGHCHCNLFQRSTKDV